jgi:hypothetical protein
MLIVVSLLTPKPRSEDLVKLFPEDSKAQA